PANEDERATALTRELSRLPHGAMAVHVRDDDHEVRALHDGLERRGSLAGQHARVAFDGMTEAFSDISIVGSGPIEPADDADVHMSRIIDNASLSSAGTRATVRA